MTKSLAPLEYAFGENLIRVIGTDRDLWFVAKDVCEALGIVWKRSETLGDILPEWKGIRKLRTPQTNQYGQLGFTETEVAVIAEPAVYQLAARSRKEEAKEFQRWLFGEVIPSIRKNGFYAGKRQQKYLAQGKSPEWIEGREDGMEKRKTYTDVLDEHGVDKPGFAKCTNAIYQPLLGGTASVVKVKMGLKPKANLRDSLSSRDLTLVKFAEMLASERIEADDLQGTTPCQQASLLASQAVAHAEKMSKDAPLPSAQPRLGQ